MEVPEPHWEYSEGAGFAAHGKDADLSGSVSSSPAIASFSHWKEFTSCPGGPHERRNKGTTENYQIFLTRPAKIFSIFFRREEWSYKGEAVVWKPDRLLGAESKLQLSLLMLTLMFALGRQHTNGYPRAGLLPALTHNMLTCNWNSGLHGNSLFCFSTWLLTLNPKTPDIPTPYE